MTKYMRIVLLWQDYRAVCVKVFFSIYGGALSIDVSMAHPAGLLLLSTLAVNLNSMCPCHELVSPADTNHRLITTRAHVAALGGPAIDWDEARTNNPEGCHELVQLRAQNQGYSEPWQNTVLRLIVYI